MNIAVRYHAQLKQAAGLTGEMVAIENGDTVQQLLGLLAERRPPLRRLLLDGSGQKQATLLIFIDDYQVDSAHLLKENDEVLLLTPIAGGGCACPADNR